ncbi:MAG: transglutaminase-like domain-containing protein [Candidatus Odinarchaeum yellowstonii]|uniref:Transglutaminase-like domain-containing protein n=1 Tax=Odinarchaeota yellowstonii (strain LCB_4) TaxID=1841599 RepID=A0AAF0IBG4_ODILC|nr:MAG: transglutaminase-like domain-containing protein [Candidatus Odinarchaeum yellowstonii]
MQQPFAFTTVNNGIVDFYYVNYNVEFNITFTNLGASAISNLEIWVASINNRTTGGLYESNLQNAYLTYMNPTPQAVLRDVNNPDNQLLYFNASIPGYSNYSIILRYNISSFEKMWLINPTVIENYNTSSEIYLNYTKPEPFIESDNPTIVAFATQLAAGVENPLLTVKKFYDWVSTNIRYQIQTEEHGALWALENMRGDCSEYADLFIALCRACGIPARKVLGWAFSDLVENQYLSFHRYTSYSAHAWVEVYFERYGWIVFDPTWGNSGFYYFSRVDPFHLAAIIGENVSTTGFNTTEFSFIAYRVSGSPNLSYDFTITLEVAALASLIKYYSFESLLIIGSVLAVVLFISGLISKRALKRALKSV